MNVAPTVEPITRAAWRAWLAGHHGTQDSIWLLYGRGAHARPGELTYLDAVLEALCFGWIDGLAKKQGELSAQRFTPRRARSHWTELNKERARRLIAAGAMAEAGRKILPDLSERALVLPADVEARLRQDPVAWDHFQRFPDLYKRVRTSYIDEVKDKAERERRLGNFLERTRKNELFGNWDDSALPVTKEPGRNG
ncbi:MAG: YdeI/OmpD-associated family protein [Byssovorax sp.]